jgi:hypothetical protein
MSEYQQFPTFAIPNYRIDLGLPPSERYIKMASDLDPKMQALVHLFDRLIREDLLPAKLEFIAPLIHMLARLGIRKMYDAEEAEEVKSISEYSGVQLHILVILNVLLDSLTGCTSGAALVQPRSANKSPRMMHFRTSDIS